MVINSRDNDGRVPLCFYLKVCLLAAGITNITTVSRVKQWLFLEYETGNNNSVCDRAQHSSMHFWSGWWTTGSLDPVCVFWSVQEGGRSSCQPHRPSEIKTQPTVPTKEAPSESEGPSTAQRALMLGLKKGDCNSGNFPVESRQEGRRAGCPTQVTLLADLRS